MLFALAFRHNDCRALFVPNVQTLFVAKTSANGAHQLCFNNESTLLMVLIIEEACWMAATEFRRYHTWTLAATVKHWREQLASKQPRKRRRVVRPISEDTDDM